MIVTPAKRPVKSSADYGIDAARVYNELHRDQLQKVVLAVARHAVSPGTSLDVGCGTGTLVRELRKLGWTASGIDRSRSMVQQARVQDPSGDYRCGDARRFNGRHRLSLVTATFDVVNHLKSLGEVDSFLRCSAASLRAGGTLLFDSVTPADIASNWADYVHYTPRKVWSLVRYGEQVNEHHGRLHYHYFMRQSDGRFERVVEIHDIRVWTKAQLMTLLTRNGFKNIRFMDAHTLSRPRTTCVRWLIAAERQAER